MEIRNKIKELFRHNDTGFIKLAQRMCHFYRISYYVVVIHLDSRRRIAGSGNGPRRRIPIRRFIQYFIELKHIPQYLGMRKVDFYKIELKERNNGTTAKIKQEHSQTSPDVWEEII